MSVFNVLQSAAFVIVVAVLVKPLGGYMSRVFSGQKTLFDPLLLPVERLIYRLTELTPNGRWIGRNTPLPSSFSASLERSLAKSELHN